MENQLDPEPRQNEPEKLKIIGLTGGIGSGKTTVAQLLEKHGFKIYYSDVRAKEIVNDNADLKNQIIALLGSEAYDENGMYNRKFVSKKVFDDAALLAQLNALIHPAVKIDFEQWISQQNTEFIFKETALLFELKLNETCYKSVLVTADDNLRMKRVMDRDGKTYREVEKVMEKQMPEKDKIRKADFIIYNNGNLEDLALETNKMISDLIYEK